MPDVDPDELLAVAAAAEASSEHPLAEAVTAAARQRRLSLPPVTDFTSTPGFGVRVEVDSRRVLVGRPSFLAESGIDLSPLVLAGRTMKSQYPPAPLLVGGLSIGLDD